MKNLEDYLPQKPRKKTPANISESPILSPDTLDALEKAESLVKEARKTILEASYDIASSPEREKSARSGTEDEDALYIRDIVAARFYEANESARIFTRPSTRPLAERICRPIARPRRARRVREKGSKICCSEQSTTSRLRSMHASRDSKKSPTISVDGCQKGPGKSSLPQRTVNSEEIPTRIPKDTSEFPGPWRIGNQNVANSFGVQQGPRVDIRNELTATNVEKVVISPRPRSSLPAQRNIKTYEFQHESCVEKTVDETTNAREEARSTEAPIGDDVEARDSLETAEKSRDPIRKSCGIAAAAASQLQGSRSDLVENKSGRSIPAERLEGHADPVCTGFANRAEHVSRRNEENIDNKENERNTGNTENRDEGFMDFLRRSGNLGKDGRTENLRCKVFDRLDTNDKINIFDRAVDQFLDEFGHDERGRVRANIAASLEQQRDKFLPEKEADSNLINDAARETDNLSEEEFRGGEYFEENWDPEEMNLQAPNFGHFEKTLKKFDCTIDKVLRGTRSLDIIISEYNFEKGRAPRSGSANQDRTCNARLFYSEPTEDISEELELKNIDHPRKKASENREERGAKDTTTKGCEELIGSCEYFNENYGASRYYTETGRDVAKKLPMEGESSSRRYDNQPRFSTPLNNDVKITRPDKSKADCKSTEFARFLIGIQRPRGLFEAKEKSDPARDFARFENRNEGKIVLNRNEFLPAPTRNDLEAQKENVFEENNKKCNFDSLFDGDRLSRAENEEKTHEIQTFPNCPTGEKAESSEVRNSGTRSLVQDSAIGPGTDRSDEISVGTKLIDECNAKKDSSRSEQCRAPERDSTKSKQTTTKKDTQFEAVDSKNIESGRTKTLTMKNNSVQSIEKAQNSDKKLSTALQPADVAKTSNLENEHSAKDKVSTNKKNLPTESPGSSLKDRTSFDISTVYSEDFEELAASDEKSKAQGESESSRSAGLKSITNRSETAAAKLEVQDNKKRDDETLLRSSLQSSATEKLYEESRKEAQYLEKSVSMSASKLSGKIEENKKDESGGSREAELVAEEKGTVECNSETKEADKILPVEPEKPCRDEDAASTSESTKVSGTSSIAGVSRREETNKNSEGHLDHRESTKISGIDSDRDIHRQRKSPIEFDFLAGQMNLAFSGKSDEFVRFESSVAFHSTPKQLNSNASPETHNKKFHPSKGDARSESEEMKKMPRVGKADEMINRTCGARAADLGEMTNFASPMMIDSTPQRQIENSRCARREFLSPVSDPIPDDDHANAAATADTCSENYSEGELYLPSSCSYSLGEIRISERGSCGTVGPVVIQSSVARNADGMRIYFSRKAQSLANNAIKASNSPARSPGELQETDVESISSSRSATSEGEHRMLQPYTLQLRPADA